MKILFLLLIIPASSYALDCYNCNSEEKGCGETSFLLNGTVTCGGACLKMVIKSKNDTENAVFRGCSELTEATCGVLTASLISLGEVQFCGLCTANLCNSSSKINAGILLSIVTLLSLKTL